MNPSTSAGEYIPAATAQTAYNSALTKHGILAASTLDLSNSQDRTTVFGVLEDAITNLENALGVKFNATTNSAI